MARVTLVVNNADEGSETFLHRLSVQLTELGHDVTVHALLAGRASMATGAAFDPASGTSRSSALPPGLRQGLLRAAAGLAATDPHASFEAVRRSVVAFGRCRRASSAAALAAPLLATRPDVVHLAFSGIGVALVDALELLDPSTCVLVSCRGSGELVSPVVRPSVLTDLGRVLRRADGVHAVAAVVATAAIHYGADPERVRVIRPAVDIDTLSPRVAAMPSGGRSRIVSVARLHWVKGIELQLDAAARLVADGRPLEWIIIGDGPERTALELRSAEMGLGDVVCFAGAMTPSAVVDELNRADVAVSSSWSEGTSNSVLEAMALGVPVVSTAAGGMPEVLTHGADALLVPVGDAAGIARCTAELLDDPSRARLIGESARRTVQSRHRVQDQQAAWGRFYEELVGAHR